MAAASDEVVDLGVAADLDDATSKLFFSDGDVAGAAVSWPAAEKIRSTLLGEDTLRSLCCRYGVPKEYTPRCAGQVAPCQTLPAAGAGGGTSAICVYAAALDAGMRFPLHPFYVSVLRHYNLAPSQLSPNAWSYMAGFVKLCKDAGVDPVVSVFRYFFSICGHRGDSLGWYHFQPCTVAPYTDGRQRRRLFTGALQSRTRWKTRFFFLEPPPEMPLPYASKWGKPLCAAVGRMTGGTMSSAVREAVTMVLEHLEREVGAARASTGIDISRVVSLLPDRDLPVGSPPAPVKAEAGASSAAAAAAAAGGSPAPDPTRKRKSLPAAVTTPPTHQHQHHQSFPGSGMASSFGGAGGSSSTSELSLPPGIWASGDAVHPWGTRTMDAEKVRLQEELRAANAKVAELQIQVREAKAWSAQMMDFMRAAGAEAAQLKAAEVAKHAAEVAKLREEHAAEVAKLNRDHASAVDRLRKEMVLEAKKEMGRSRCSRAWTSRCSQRMLLDPEKPQGD